MVKKELFSGFYKVQEFSPSPGSNHGDRESARL